MRRSSLTAQYAFGYCALRALMAAVEQFDRHALGAAQEADAHARPHRGRLARELDALGLELGHHGIDAIAAELKAKGVEFTREPTTVRPGTRVCFIKAPEGVSIELLDRNV